MDDLCIHCGAPVVDTRTTWGLIHCATGSRECADGTGRQACLAQGGIG